MTARPALRFEGTSWRPILPAWQNNQANRRRRRSRRRVAPHRDGAAMILILRKSSTQAHIEGLARLDWGEDDYAIIDIEPASAASIKIRFSANEMAMVPADGSDRPFHM
jgi:hypothetical protein